MRTSFVTINFVKENKPYKTEKLCRVYHREIRETGEQDMLLAPGGQMLTQQMLHRIKIWVRFLLTRRYYHNVFNAISTIWELRARFGMSEYNFFPVNLSDWVYARLKKKENLGIDHLGHRVRATGHVKLGVWTFLASTPEWESATG